MSDATGSDFPAACSRLQRKLSQWRQQRRPRARIPEELWRGAAQLARTHGINRTARALRLDYYSLKERATALAGSGVLRSSWNSCPAGWPPPGPRV